MMIQMLMTLAGGKVVLVLEGGYDLGKIGECAAACIEALLGGNISSGASICISLNSALK